jgi:hypothetical protein
MAVKERSGQSHFRLAALSRGLSAAVAWMSLFFLPVASSSVDRRRNARSLAYAVSMVAGSLPPRFFGIDFSFSCGRRRRWDGAFRIGGVSREESMVASCSFPA